MKARAYKTFVTAFKNAQSKEQEAALLLKAVQAEAKNQTKVQELVNKSDLKLTEAHLMIKMKKLKFDIIKWLIGTMVAGMWLPILLLKLKLTF